MLSLASVTFAYPHTPPVFEGFSWRAASGESWAVLGPSGCGKTTLLYLLAGLRTPSAGRVLVHGQTLTRPRPQTGLILQDYGLLPWATVRQNAALGLRLRRFYGPDGKHAPRQPAEVPTAGVDAWLERLGIASFADKFPAQLSGGQRQRTAIARTLALQPDLLLMDEPFSSLDAPTRENLQALTHDLCAENNLTLVVVTHTIEEAAVLGKQILLLGQAPNRSPRVIPNPGAGSPGFRERAEYAEICRELRSQMGNV